jgi:predicted double-glycine peptidase
MNRSIFCNFITIACFVFFISSCSSVSHLQSHKSIKNVSGMRSLQFRHVVEQGYDWSCGVASLTTLLQEGFGDMVQQADLIEEIDKIYMKNQTRERGLSLAEIAEVTSGRGYLATAKQLTADQIEHVGLPVIVKIDLFDEPHFIILKGHGIIRASRIPYAVVVDPAGGTRRLPFYEFQHQWLGNNATASVLLIQRKDHLWKENSSLFVETPQ